MGRIAQVCSVLLLLMLTVAQGGFSQEEAGPSGDWLSQPLGAWATAAFIWLVLFLAMAFVVAMGWLGRSRRY